MLCDVTADILGLRAKKARRVLRSWAMHSYHRHFMGTVEAFAFIDYESLVIRFQAEVGADHV